MIYYRLKSVLFTHALFMLIILFLSTQYVIVGQDKSPRVQYLYSNALWMFLCLLEKCVNMFVGMYMFETNFVFGYIFQS